MRSVKAKNGTIFNYNSDMSGTVSIYAGEQEVDINGEDLLEFVAEYIRSKKIEKLEQLSWQKVLGLDLVEA